ncbi:hypothetical protein LDENG_00272420 [Lucifuga dentata]|nr:hypothetical protein LDENG_00272420 [Lucifuga dentata]
MENFSKARKVEHPCPCPFPGLSATTPEVHVKDGSKIRNLLRFALSRMEVKPRAAEWDEKKASAPDGEGQRAGRPLSQQIVFTATGRGVSKAITCTEMVKRHVKGLHQLTRLRFRTVEEVWELLQPASGLDSLTVSRNLPAIWILLSTEPLDCSQPGYQGPGRYGALREDAGGFSGWRPKRKRGRRGEEEEGGRMGEPG